MDKTEEPHIMTDKKPLKIYLAAPRGFCAGVDRAIQIVELALKKYGAPVYVRHEIVHNKFVVDGLRDKGAVFVEELEECPDDRPVIFSAHGVPKSVPAAAQAREVAAAWDVARTASLHGGDLDPAHAEHHRTASRVMAFAAGPDLTAPEAWSLATLAAAHRVAAGEARARRMVRELGELIDVYDDVTGRVADAVAPRDAAALAARL